MGLGHFLLLQLLMPNLKAASNPPARIIATSSCLHWYHTSDIASLLPTASRATTSIEGESLLSGIHQYGNTKFLQVSMIFELQRRLRAEGSNISAIPLTPGYIQTQVGSTNRDAAVMMPGSLPISEGFKTT